MAIFLSVCAGLATAALVVAVVELVLTLHRLRRMAQALEGFALNADGKLDTFRGFFDAIRSVSDGMRSGWFKGLQFVMELVSAYRRSSSQKDPGKTA